MTDQLSALDLDTLERRALAWPGNNLQPEIHVLVQRLREVEAGFNSTNEALSAAEARIAQLERVRKAAGPLRLRRVAMSDREQRDAETIIADWLLTYSGGGEIEEYRDKAQMLIGWLRDEGWEITQTTTPRDQP